MPRLPDSNTPGEEVPNSGTSDSGFNDSRINDSGITRSEITSSWQGSNEDSRALTRALLELAVDAIITIDERGTIRSFNPAAERLFLYTAEEVLGKNVSILMPAPHSEQHDKYLQTYLETGIARIIGLGREEWARRKDGTTFPMELGVSEIRDGERRWFTGILRDISDRKSAEERLRHERDFTEAVLDTTDSLVVVLDDQGTIVRTNRACQRLARLEENELVGKHLHDFLPSEQRSGLDEALRAAYEDYDDTGTSRGSGLTRHRSYWLRADSTRRVISWSHKAMFRADGTVEYVVATGIDITEERQAQLRSRQHEKLVAVGQLASGIAHEIGNPLASISAVTQTLLRKVPDEFVRKKLELVSLHIDRISNTVRQTMNFARHPRLEWKSCDLNDVVKEAMGIVAYDKRARNVDIDLQLAPNLPCGFFIADLVQQVVVNLALNGLDALEGLDPDKPRRLIVQTHMQSQDSLAVVVSDNGPGIPPSILPRLMEPFFTTKDVGKGTGLGLAVSYRAVQDHGGEITIRNLDRGGAEFAVTLPLRLVRPEQTSVPPEL